MIEKTLSYINKHSLIKPNTTIVVGLSGGPDSVCLLQVLKQLQPKLNLTLIAAHLDHEWRNDSSQDALFCKQYAESLGIEFIQSKVSQIDNQKKYNGSHEEQGRLLRRIFFKSVADQYKADSIALGHHQDDQQETFLLRLIRGASIAGLAGMKPQDKEYIRPLLGLYKKDIHEYLERNNLTYVHDSTNESDTFLRNALRLKVLPALKTCDSRFNKNFEKTHAHIQETDAFIARLVQKIFQDLARTEDGEIWIDIEKLLAADTFLHHSLLLTWLCAAQVSFTPSTGFFEEIIRFLKNSGSQHQPEKNWKIVKKVGVATIKKLLTNTI